MAGSGHHDPRGQALPREGDLEEFCLVGHHEAPETAAAPVEWPAGERTPRGRFASLLRLGRSVAPQPAAPSQKAPWPSQQQSRLVEIPMLSLPLTTTSPARTFIGPFSLQPIGGPSTAGGFEGAAAWSGFGCTAKEDVAFAMEDPFQHSPWLHQQQPEPASVRSSSRGITICSSSSEDSEEAGAYGGGGTTCSSSFCLLQRPSATALSPNSSSTCGSSGTRRSSGSDLVNQLMLQGEPGMAAAAPGLQADAPYPALLSVDVLLPVMPGVPAASQQQPQQQQQQAVPVLEAALASTAGYTPNPLLQPEQVALLSWRRNAWQHSEQQEPELLHRLLSGSGEDGNGWGAAGATSPMSTAAAMTGRSRATGKHLLAMTSILALAVVLLHLLHSHALGEQLAGEQEEQLLQAQREVAPRAIGLSGPSEASASMLLRGRRGSTSAGWAASRALSSMPRIRLRHHLALLLFTQRSAAGGTVTLGDGSTKAKELVLEEWELSA